MNTLRTILTLSLLILATTQLPASAAMPPQHYNTIVYETESPVFFSDCFGIKLWIVNWWW